MTSPRLRLVPTADVATLGPRCYLFDRAALHDNVVSIPTQRISRRLHDVVHRLKTEWPSHEPRPLEDFLALFETEAERSLVMQLVRAGYLERVEAPGSGTEAASADDAVAHFRERVLKHFFKPASFFNLPAQIEDDECEVAIVGVPVSSTLISSGTVDAPARLRRDSQRAGFWFDFHARGVYTETGCDGTTPRLLCAGTRLKDCGDIGRDTRTVGELFTALSSLLDDRLLPAGARPLFVGGDHAITFPIVDSLLRHYPDLVLVHLDAHNDLFYTERVEYNHAGPIHALIAHSGLQQVLSFGLRTTGDPRVHPYQRLLAAGVVEERVRLYSLPALERWLSRPMEFRAHLRECIPAGAPVYLTIDLDVLSADAIAGQLSTPAGPGLAWHQLLETTVLVCDEFDVVAADVVEFNPDHKNRAVHDERELTVLLLELIDGLARARRRAGDVVPAATVASAIPSSPPVTQRPAAVPGRGYAAPVPVARHDVDELGFIGFLERYALPGIPVILTGFQAQWPALTRWSLERFRDALREDELVDVLSFAKPYATSAVSRRAQSARDTLRRFIERSRGELAADAAREYIVDWQFADTCAALLGDYRTPAWFDHALNDQVVPPPNTLRWLFVGEAGTASATHVDILNTSAWLMLVSGRKQWRMVAAAEASACGRIGDFADLFAPHHARHPALASVTLFEAEQQPGEVMWTPSGCVHAVRNLQSSIALTQNYVDLTNVLAVHDGMYRDALAMQRAPAAPDALAQLIRAGRDAWLARGDSEAWQLLQAALLDGIGARRRAATVHSHSLDAAMRELRRTG